ncbi:MAG TPA: chaperonin GroEL [Bacilli bacterium]|nr:chaperonin GroEL [Bacilli bacterium]
MSKQLKFSKDARYEMAKGIECLYNATRITLGPKGRNVIIEQEFGSPQIVNDGVTIAKAISLPDRFMNMGSSVVIEAASKTNDVVGDGTTTAILLASNLILEGLKYIDKGVNPVMLQKGLQNLLPKIIEEIDKVSTPIESFDDLANIASISSGSAEIGKLIKEAYQEVGTDGVITVEESQSINTYLDVVKGYAYDRGYLSPYMANQAEKQIAVLEKPLILIIDKKINTMNEIMPVLEETVKSARPLLIICDDMEQEVLGALIVNKLRGVFQVVVTKAPGFGDRKTQLLTDLAVVTGATYLDSNLISSEPISPKVLGSAAKVIVTKDQTTIVDGSGDSDNIIKHTEKLKAELAETKSEYEKEKLSERIAKILSGIAVIKVGAPTETELKDKKLRLEDALNSTKAASSSGIIEGGGKVFYQISKKLSSFVTNDDFKPAADILKAALQAPFRQIVENAGANFEEVLQKVSDKVWFDASTGNFVSLIEKGIIDPTSVAKSALINAVSVASTFLTTECAIVNVDTKRKDVEDPLS